MTIEEVMDEYIKRNKQFLKPRTLICYNERKNRTLKLFGNVDVEVITQEFLQNYIFEQQKLGRTKAAITNDLTLLICSLKQIKKFNTFKFKNSFCDVKKEKFYSDDEINKIEDYILKSKKLWNKPAVAIILAINTGMRIGEICGLKWKDINLTSGEISVSRQVIFLKGEIIEDESPKTQCGFRTIPINTYLLNFLREKKDCATDDCYVTSNSIIPHKSRSIQRSNALICKKLLIQPKGMHAYRHSFATKLLKSSQDFKAISQIMGHSSITITESIYNHPALETKKSIVNNAFEIPSKIEQSNFIDIQFLQNQINELYKIIGSLECKIINLYNQIYKI